VVVIVLGVAGAGKTTIGRALADRYGWRFVDADDHHAPAAIAKMRAGVALTDADRAPWLASLHAIASAVADRRDHIVIACSALKQRYRDVLRGSLRHVRFVYLKADEATFSRRLSERSGHFAGPTLLTSQLADLEEPADALTIDATRPPEEIVDAIAYELGLY
jgi:carbohydrate kinase (thermoresistant glucokinase family)